MDTHYIYSFISNTHYLLIISNYFKLSVKACEEKDAKGLSKYDIADKV